MLIHLRFDFRRPHLEAGRIDHSLQAIDQEEVTVLVDVAEIAGAEEALAVELDERGARRFFVAPVAAENLRAVRDDLADLPWRQLLAACPDR